MTLKYLLTWSIFKRNVLLTLNWRTAVVFLGLIPLLCFAPLYYELLPETWMRPALELMGKDLFTTLSFVIVAASFMVLPMNAASKTKSELATMGYHQPPHLPALAVWGLLFSPVLLLFFDWSQSRLPSLVMSALASYGLALFHLGFLWVETFRKEDYKQEDQMKFTESKASWAEPLPPKTSPAIQAITFGSVRQNIIYTSTWVTALVFLVDFPLIYALMAYGNSSQDRVVEMFGRTGLMTMILCAFVGISIPTFVVAHFENKLERTGHLKKAGRYSTVTKWALITPAIVLHGTPLRNQMPWYAATLSAIYAMGLLWYGRIWFSVYSVTSDLEGTGREKTQDFQGVCHDRKQEI